MGSGGSVPPKVVPFVQSPTEQGSPLLDPRLVRMLSLLMTKHLLLFYRCFVPLGYSVPYLGRKSQQPPLPVSISITTL